MMDLSEKELQAGLKDSIDHYRIKSGGKRHLHQQGSLVGHLRRLGVFENTESDLTLLEMGAGRGMFGLMAAGVAAAAAHSKPSTQLVLVERSGTRSKADGVLRMAKDATDYMALNKVQFSRISCDLAHVHMPTVIQKVASTNSKASVGSKRKHDNQNKTVVIAKHLCGAGTDLALKSLDDINVDACVMATCCHGICSWEHYVGRNFLKALLGEDFGSQEFDLMRRWSSGTVTSECSACQNKKTNDDEHGKCSNDDGKDPMSIASIIQSLELTSLCREGLGRACQRLLDQGRLEYIRQVLLADSDECQVEMFHYVPSSVTPQNAVLVAHRK
jgi:tRNA:m4X modification enzyme